MTAGGGSRTVDAVVVGAGPNGLVAANVLADRGWKVLVCEAGPEAGGAVRSGEVIEPGFISDLFSAFYPLAAASPVLDALDLGRWGLRWRRSPLAVAHPGANGELAAIDRTAAGTAALVGTAARADGGAWLELVARWDRIGPAFVRTLLGPVPPLRAGAGLLARASRSDLRWLGRTALTPVRRLCEELFEGESAQLLVAGLALHADLPPESPGSGLFGWLMAGLAQQVGFPVPEGGAARLTQALVRRLEAKGGEVLVDASVTRIVVEHGVARGVIVGDRTIVAERAVLATSTARALYRELLRDTPLPARIEEGLARWQPGAGTVKVDWALDGPIPWSDPRLADAGTVHLSDSVDDLSRFACALATRAVPSRPFVVVGQMTSTDPSRSPEGTESAWGYTHVAQDPPAGRTWDRPLVDEVVGCLEAEIERKAPGFGTLVRGRYVQGPIELEAADANLISGDMNAGTAQLHQQLVFRPFPGLARPETFVKRLYLAGASAHPGGGVHGAPGANAARAAVTHDRVQRLARTIAGPWER